MRKFIPITFILLLMHGLINAQLITAVPAFPTDADSVAIYFDASLGNKALKGYTGDVYAHTGVITDKSTSGSDWKYVKTNWGVNSEETKLTRISTDKYVLKIKPGVRAYYNVPEGEKIVKMAFVFRSSDSKLEGKSETGGDIYYDIYSDKLSVDIVTPDQKPYIINVNTTVVIKLAANKADSVQLLINNVRKSSTTAAELNATYTPTLMGKYSIKAVAWANNESVTDSTYFFAMGAVNEADLPYAGLVDGINYKDANTVTLVLYAPFKNYVFAIGDFSNWEVNADVLMNRRWQKILDNPQQSGSRERIRFSVPSKWKPAYCRSLHRYDTRSVERQIHTRKHLSQPQSLPRGSDHRRSKRIPDQQSCLYMEDCKLYPSCKRKHGNI